MTFQICCCGAQPGFPHRPDCPRPLFNATDSQFLAWEADWMRKQDATNYAKELEQSLPTWHFEAYGCSGKVAAYPPASVSADAWAELSAIAHIDAVCGPLYVVTPISTATPVA